MEEDTTTHPDEGTIHAWLDGALDAPAAARIAEHVRSCESCTERVAEARGLIAGASRIVASLDDVPAGTRAGWAQSAPESGAGLAPSSARERGEGTLWRWLHVTPARAAIAATILVALGITMTRNRTGPDDLRTAATTAARLPEAPMTSDSANPSVASAREGAPAPANAPAESHDALLDSAIKRNLAIAQPPRALDAARGPAIPQPTPAEPVIGLAKVDTTAPARVAAARSEAQAQREQRADIADKSRVRSPAVASAMSSPGGNAGVRAAGSIDTGVSSGYGGAMTVYDKLVGVATKCYLIESSAPSAQWGGQSLPLLVAADSAARLGQSTAPVLTAAGRSTAMTAHFAAGRADSLTLTLRRIGYSGSIALGPDVGGRVGVAYSAPTTTELEAVVVAGAAPRRDVTGAVASTRKATDETAGAARAEAPPIAPAAARNAAPSQSRRAGGSPVTMRLVSCPAH